MMEEMDKESEDTPSKPEKKEQSVVEKKQEPESQEKLPEDALFEKEISEKDKHIEANPQASLDKFGEKLAKHAFEVNL